MILSPLFGSTADLRNQDTDRSGTIGFNEVHPHHHIPFPTSDLSPVCWFMEIYQGVYLGHYFAGVRLSNQKKISGLAGRVPPIRPRQVWQHQRQ